MSEAHPSLRPLRDDIDPEHVRAAFNSDDHASVYQLIKELSHRETCGNSVMIEVEASTSKVKVGDAYYHSITYRHNLVEDVKGTLDLTKQLDERYINRIVDIGKIGRVEHLAESVTMTERYSPTNGYLRIDDLIAVMEEREIGRPSTYASSISDMLAVDNGLIRKDASDCLELGDLGHRMSDAIHSSEKLFVLDHRYCQMMEKALEDIRNGVLSRDEVIKQMTSFICDGDLIFSFDEWVSGSVSDRFVEQIEPYLTPISFPILMNPMMNALISDQMRLVGNTLDEIEQQHPYITGVDGRLLRAIVLAYATYDEVHFSRFLSRVTYDLRFRNILRLGENEVVWHQREFYEVVNRMKVEMPKVFERANELRSICHWLL